MPPLWSRTYGLNDVAVDCLHDGASIMPCAWRDIENNLSMKRPRTAGLLQSGHCPYDNTWNKNFDSRRSSAIENFTFEHSSLNPGYFWMVIIIYIYINFPDCLIEIWKRVYLNSTEELSQKRILQKITKEEILWRRKISFSPGERKIQIIADPKSYLIYESLKPHWRSQ